MANYAYCEVNLPDHVTNDCNEYKQSGIGAYAIGLFGHGIIDPSSAVQWQAAIDAGTVKIVGGCVKGIKAQYPQNSPVEQENDSSCGPLNIVIGYDHEVTIRDANVNESNDEFYGLLTNVKGADLFIWYCEEDEVRVVAHDVVWTSSNPISGEPRTSQHYMISAKWYTTSGEGIGSELHPAPEGIFC